MPLESRSYCIKYKIKDTNQFYLVMINPMWIYMILELAIQFEVLGRLQYNLYTIYLIYKYLLTQPKIDEVFHNKIRAIKLEQHYFIHNMNKR